MKKYLLLVEDERLWEKFKEVIKRDLNSEIIELIRHKVTKGNHKNPGSYKTPNKNGDIN